MAVSKINREVVTFAKKKIENGSNCLVWSTYEKEILKSYEKSLVLYDLIWNHHTKNLK